MNWSPRPSAASLRGWHLDEHRVLGVERLELLVRGLGKRRQYDGHDDDLAEGDDADHAAVAEPRIAEAPHQQDAEHAAQQRRRGEQARGTPTVAGRKELGAVYGEGRIGDSADEAA